MVLFSGGRGSGALTTQLVSNPRIDLVLAINGYDDGASTGEVRRFLGDALGPSDFRKNASRLARVLKTSPEPLVELLDLRLQDDAGGESLARRLAAVVRTGQADAGALEAPARLSAALPEATRTLLHARLARFADDLATGARPFRFDDASLGNFVFAGSYLVVGRDFNARG